MAILVVGGQARHAGKTSLVTGLIAAFPEHPWTAVKISQHLHDIEKNGADYAISEERERSGFSDTARYLQAGARRAFWVRTRPGCLRAALPSLRLALADAVDVIFESNRVLQFLHPDLCLMVLDPANPDFKLSAREFLGRADAVIVPPGARAVSPPLWDKPVFKAEPDAWIADQLVRFVRERMDARGSSNFKFEH